MTAAWALTAGPATVSRATDGVSGARGVAPGDA